MAAMIRVERSPDLSADEIEWVRKLAVRMMADFTLAQADRPEHEEHPVAA